MKINFWKFFFYTSLSSALMFMRVQEVVAADSNTAEEIQLIAQSKAQLPANEPVVLKVSIRNNTNKSRRLAVTLPDRDFYVEVTNGKDQEVPRTAYGQMIGDSRNQVGAVAATDLRACLHKGC